MADQEALNPIVQRMIDAGESEDNIATVIQHFKAQAPTALPAPTRMPMNVQEGTPAPDWKSNLAGALEPLAHPQSLGDFANLLIPSEGAAVVGKALAPVGAAVKKYGGAAAELAGSFMPMKAKAALGVLKTLSPSKWNSPLTVAGREGRATAVAQQFNALPLAEQMKSLPETAAPAMTRGVSPPIRNLGNEAPLIPSGPHMNLSQPVRPGALTQDQIGERIAAMQAQGGSQIPQAAAKPVLGGRLLTGRPEPTPMRMAELQQKFGDTQPESSPLLQPRTEIGAEAAGRQAGMSKQAVRNATGPIRGEEPGAAAGMPSKPKDRIVQTLIDMGPKGQGLPESAREAYAASATSDKARLQVQAYLDALRKVGFVGGPILAAPAVMQRKGILDAFDQ